MTIYTKTGDEGFTSRPGGQRLRKSHALFAALGGLDELSSHLGLCLRQAQADREPFVAAAIEPLQAELLTAGALLAAADGAAAPSLAVDESAVTRMERQIDEVWARLPELTHFILPRGCELACRLHVARTVCRRAEREMVAAGDAGIATPPAVQKYVNRLSDLLFALARRANHSAGLENDVWRP